MKREGMTMCLNRWYAYNTVKWTDMDGQRRKIKRLVLNEREGGRGEKQERTEVVEGR